MRKVTAPVTHEFKMLAKCCSISKASAPNLKGQKWLHFADTAKFETKLIQNAMKFGPLFLYCSSAVLLWRAIPESPKHLSSVVYRLFRD